MRFITNSTFFWSAQLILKYLQDSLFWDIYSFILYKDRFIHPYRCLKEAEIDARDVVNHGSLTARCQPITTFSGVANNEFENTNKKALRNSNTIFHNLFY